MHTSLKAVLSGKTQWRLMSTFWHKMSDLKPVCSDILCQKVDKTSLCFSLNTALKARPSNFKMHTSLKAVTERAQKQWRFRSISTINVGANQFQLDILCQKVDIKRHCVFPLNVSLEEVCILKLEGLLQGCVKWKNTMTFNVNFLTQNVDLKPVCSINMWKLTENSYRNGEGTKIWVFGQFPHINWANWFQIRHFVSESWH